MDWWVKWWGTAQGGEKTIPAYHSLLPMSLVPNPRTRGYSIEEVSKHSNFTKQISSQENGTPSTEFPLCDLPLFAPPSTLNGRYVNKLGWAGPHSRFPLSFPLISPSVIFYTLCFKVIFHCIFWFGRLSLTLNLRNIWPVVAEIFHF